VRKKGLEGGWSLVVVVDREREAVTIAYGLYV
jgi:hypothetical protein